MPAEAYFQLLNPLMFLLFSVGLACVFAASRQMRGTVYLGASYAIGAAAFVVDFLRDGLPLMLSPIITNSLYTLALVLFAVGICRKYDVAAPVRLIFAAAVLNLASVFFFLFAWPDMWLRSFAVNIGNGLVLLPALIAIRKQAMRLVDVVILAALTGMIAQLFARPFLLWNLAWEPLTLETYTQSTFYMVLHLVVGVFALTIGMALLVSYWQRVVAELRARADTDPLSGILNRRGFEDEMVKMIAKADSTGKPLSVILADIDNFKEVNDSCGHALGDQVIARLGQIFGQYHAGSYLAGRMGGDEFALVLADMNLADAREIAEDIRQTFANALYAEAAPGATFTVSLGVVQRERCEPLPRALARVDEALYVSKNMGRNRVTCETDVELAKLGQKLKQMGGPAKAADDRRTHDRHPQVPDAEAG